mgnify:CR=1 FL=1
MVSFNISLTLSQLTDNSKLVVFILSESFTIDNTSDILELVVFFIYTKNSLLKISEKAVAWNEFVTT